MSLLALIATIAIAALVVGLASVFVTAFVRAWTEGTPARHLRPIACDLCMSARAAVALTTIGSVLLVLGGVTSSLSWPVLELGVIGTAGAGAGVSWIVLETQAIGRSFVHEIRQWRPGEDHHGQG